MTVKPIRNVEAILQQLITDSFTMHGLAVSARFPKLGKLIPSAVAVVKHGINDIETVH